VSKLVFDSTALSHFARAGRLAELEAVTAADKCIVPTNVLGELTRGVAAYPALGTVSAQGWLHPAEIDQFDEVVAFARYKGELGCGPERNNGEATVLAWVTVHGGIAIIDEDAATKIGDRDGLQVQGSFVVSNPGLQRQGARSCHS
jgi:predicted nucleic acid-binding protein